MQNRLIKVIQKREDAENGVQRKEKFKFKSEAKEDKLKEENHLNEAPDLSKDQINNKIYSNMAAHNQLLIYEDVSNPLKPLQLVKIIMNQINNDIQNFRKKL